MHEGTTGRVQLREEGIRRRTVSQRIATNQGEECGVSKLNSKTDPDIMPARIKDGEFKIVQRHEAFDAVIFKVKGTFQTNAGDVIAGNYSQVACDGAKDTFVVYLEVE